MKKTILNNKVFYELDVAECKKMMQIADEYMKNCYPKADEGFSVSVMTDKGTIYPGVSYGSDTYTLTMHSEMVALANAATNGERDIVAVTGPNCHICKQILYESGLRSGIDINVILEDGEDFKQVPLSEMMPYAWPDEPTM